MNEIELCLSEMQAFFQNGNTLSIAWRKEQLKKLKDGIRSYEKQILNALYEDLGKTDFEGFASELGIVYTELDEHLKHLDAWAAKQRVR
ncbi:MAG TPA: aldehyde dehydrogenase family protein, partial [Sphaerochaeta sp.]|nr:aldehyde dehydrogenase family protein [Sphaerochaeta sp.]